TNPSNVDAAAAALDLQNLQTPGANQRIQAALQDPTVARSASRAYGDFQLGGMIGTNEARDGRFSYLHETDDRRGLYGARAEYDKNGGALPNSDTVHNRLGLVYGRKAKDNPSGVFALATYEHID